MSEKMSHNYESTLLIMDWDDTLFDTAKFRRIQEAMWRRKFSAVSLAAIAAAQKEYESGRDLFRPQRAMSPEEWSATLAHGRRLAPLFLFADVRRFLRQIAVHGDMHDLILTYGDRDFQNVKIKPTQEAVPELRGVPVIYAERKDKSQWLQENWDEEGQVYRIGQHAAQHLILLDDKPASFVGFAELNNVRGYLVDRNGRAHDLMLPNNVQIVSNLTEITL
jgi:hypothetical protein